MWVVNYYDKNEVKVFKQKENAFKELLNYYVNEVLPSYIHDATNGNMMGQTAEGAYQDVLEDLNKLLGNLEIPYFAEIFYVEDFSD